MAVELGRFLADQLTILPDTHPDRRFLTGLHAAVTAYTEREPPVDPPETPALAADHAPPAAPEPRRVQAQAEPEERQRVVLRGRLGKRVRFTTTPKGVRRAEFNLAVAATAEQTDWHTVLAFRERADVLEQAGLKQGQLLEVIGYRQTEQRQTRDGEPKTVARVIAAQIRIR